jgi:hypothetical protein
MRHLALHLAAIAAFGALANAANAQSAQTFVSGAGDDANACTRAAPCKTFAGAITKTNAGGDIICLNSAGYGAVTIVKSISILCDGNPGGIAVSSSGAITVNAASTDVVVLSGLELDGLGAAITGINASSMGALHLRNVSVRNFTSAGLIFLPVSNARLYVTDSVFAENGVGGLNTDAAIRVQPQPGVAATVHVSRVRMENNFNGMSVNTVTSTTGSAKVAIDDSVMSGNASNGFLALAGTTGAPLNATIAGSMISGNFGAGVSAQTGALAIVRMGNSMISANAIGISATNGAQVRSFGDNQVAGNSNGETFSGLDALN